ncbi:hypothetical protein RZS08_56885, partial [Arthrospira platensis SPKY1]|nr:hypothetical protein [Arthrospira platensis SPKY1]
MEEYKDFFETQTDGATKVFSIRELIEYYLYYWKWILGCIILSLLIGYLFIKYSTPQYENSTSVLLKKDKTGSFSDGSFLQEFN